LRQYFPKGTHFSVHTPTRLDAVATELNARLEKRSAGCHLSKRSPALLR